LDRKKQGLFLALFYLNVMPCASGTRRRLWKFNSGKIIHERERGTRTSGDILMEWLYPLHTGEAFGFTERIISLISGFVPLMLYATGVMRWRETPKAQQNHKIMRM
jgi:uncharacterized iron-regulated membrane protein